MDPDLIAFPTDCTAEEGIDLALLALPGEHHIPLAKADLIDQLALDPELAGGEADEFRQLCRLLDATLHFEYHAQLGALKAAYGPFDPDRDTQPLVKLADEEKTARLDQLFERFTWLMERANFRRLSRQAIERATMGASLRGINLSVDFDVFDRLEIYCRGDSTTPFERRDWKRFWRREEIAIPAYERLVLIFRLRPGGHALRHIDSHDVFMKLFKDIPKMDLEMLLPGTRVQMKLLDRVKIIMPTVSGLVVSAWKAFKGALLVAAAGVYGIFALLGVTVGYGVKSFYGYLQTKQKYQLNLTESLYYQNLDNNAGVLCRLLDEAEEQENREAVLAYWFLWRKAESQGLTESELDERIEELLMRLVGRRVDFEVDDALDKLVRLGLATCGPDQRYRAVPIDEALETLDRSWDNFFCYNTGESSVAERRAA
jgi:hypothetical protein